MWLCAAALRYALLCHARLGVARRAEDANGVIDMSNRKNKKNRERRHALRIAKKVARVVAKEVGVSVKKARITILPTRSK